MRVVTRAWSMASTVSASPGPVPGAGENCAFAPRAAINNRTANPIPPTRRFTQPPPETQFVFLLSTANCRFRTSKRPLSHLPSANEKRQGSQCDLRDSPFSGRPGLPKKPRPPDHRQHRRQRIQPHLERQSLRAPAPPQHHHAHRLSDELHEQAHGKNRSEEHTSELLSRPQL